MPNSNHTELSQQTGYQELPDQETLNYERINNQRSSSSRRNIFSYRSGFWLISLLYVLTITCSLKLRPERDSGPTSNLASYGMIDIPFDDKVVFMPDEAFETPADITTEDDAWSKLEPAGRGFIELPVKIELPDGEFRIEKQYYCISMFHQLHCIASLKAAFSSMMNNTSDSNEHFKHLNHCFDYLRQAVMCAGDMTLETAVEYKEIGRKGAAGWGVEHRCRNYETIKDFAEEHAYFNSSGIL